MIERLPNGWFTAISFCFVCASACSSNEQTDGSASNILQLDTNNATVIVSSDAVILHYVRDATELENGTIVVANSGMTQVLLFGSDGSYRGSFGREGGGPGEFTSVYRVHRHIGDSIVVPDGFRWRLSFFDSDGNPGRTVNVGQLAPYASIVGLIGNAFVYQSAVWPVMPRDSLRLWISTSSEPFTTIPSATNSMVSFDAGEGTISRPHSIVFTPRAYAAAGYGIIVTGSSDEPSLQVWEEDGTSEKTIQLDLPLRAVVESEIGEYVERRRAGIRSVPRTTASLRRELQILEQQTFAEHYPLYDELEIASSGDIWVRAYVTRQDTTVTWHVYRASGEAVGQLTIPNSWNLLHAGDEHLIILVKDELDVESLMRVRWG